MKIGILGTRGIPNHYGGFEQFAQYLAVGLVEKGHEIWVYNSHNHPFQEKKYKGVNLIHCFDPENKMGTAGQFIYDLNCILDARKRNFDILLQLGYTSSSIWGKLLPNKTLVVTNMDGLEWKRSKYSKPVQNFLKKAEKWAVKTSDYLIADSLGIQNYLKEKYQVEAKYIPYGAEIFANPNEEKIKEYEVQKENYFLLIARLEPENNIETILDGFVDSKLEKPFLVIGNHQTKFGKYLKNKFKNEKQIRFLGGIYNLETLENLRYFSLAYFHGHSVGGTNPSLLEAMGSSAFIIAHDNEFNKAILENDAFYFSDKKAVSSFLTDKIDFSKSKEFKKNNLEKVKKLYNWEKIIADYETYFNKIF